LTMPRHVNIRVTGKVQGVFYRATAKDVADKLGVKGFVRNESDRTVYLEAEGEPGSIEKFIDWCKQGPPRAAVSNVEVTDGALRSFPNFEVRRW
jgi:acylphosphatase